jgi:23S rRNA (cytosine1962-C5)-methyltransferase
VERVQRLVEALAARASLFVSLHGEQTTAYRLLHGATEGAPGLTIDRYGSVLLAQTWREPLIPRELDAFVEVASAALGVVLTGVWNHRPRGPKQPFHTFHEVNAGPVEAQELGLRFDARPRHRGLDPLLFLDFRAGRRLVRDHAEGADVLNLFAYTCGIGVAAAVGGARSVLNVDFAASALAVGTDNAARNGVGDRFETLEADALPVMRLLAGLSPGGRPGRRAKLPRVSARSFDLVVLDPPRWAKSSFGAVDTVRDYPSLLKPCLLATREGGRLLVTNNVASVEEASWIQVVRRCADKCERPVRELTMVRPEADFPSPDGRPPLKMAWLQL